MQNPITELKELSLKCNSVSMLGMDTSAFEKFFAKIYGNVNVFHSQTHNAEEAEQIVKLASQLLETAVNHHKKDSASVTQNAVVIYDEIVSLLKNIVSIDLRITDSVYEEAKNTKLALDALNACGITPPGHFKPMNSSRYGNGDENETRNKEALDYAQNNIEEFTRFVYNLAFNHEYVTDPFWQQPQSSALSLFEKVKYLGSGALIVEDQSPSTDA